jgi:tRNA threonylcarbamoyladenosine biosynthesis protein TsaB
MILLLDTSSDYGVIALCDETAGCAVRSAVVFEGRRTLSRQLLGRIDTLLRSDGLTLHNLSSLAVGLGPGSFTGLRVGVTTAKILAQARDLPLCGVETLAAYAAVLPGDQAVAVATPSRRDEVYAQCFLAGKPAGPAFVCAPADLPSRCRELTGDRSIHVTGPAATLESLPPSFASRTASTWPPIDGLARALAARIAAGASDDARALVPLYVAAPVITMPKRPIPPVPLPQ